MAKFEEFQLDGCIDVNGEMDEDEFIYEFLDFMERKGWFYGGGINGYRDERNNDIDVPMRPINEEEVNRFFEEESDE